MSCGSAEHSQPVTSGVREEPSTLTGLGIKRKTCKTCLDTAELSWGLIFFFFFELNKPTGRLIPFGMSAELHNIFICLL